MSVEDNKALVTRFVELVSRSEVDAAFALLAPDCIWEIFGDLPPSGRNDKTAMRKVFDGMRETFSVGPQWIVDSIIGEDDRVAAQCRSIGEAHSGFKYRNHYHIAVRVRSGLIVELREYMDTQHADKLGRSFTKEG